MAFSKKKRNGSVVATENYTLPASATTEYSSVFPSNFKPDPSKQNQKFFIAVNASAVSGTNLDIAVYGSDSEAGATKHLLLDAVIADVTATGWASAIFDANAYPAPYYFLAWTSDADESANNIDVKIIQPVS